MCQPPPYTWWASIPQSHSPHYIQSDLFKMQVWMYHSCLKQICIILRVHPRMLHSLYWTWSFSPHAGSSSHYSFLFSLLKSSLQSHCLSFWFLKWSSFFQVHSFIPFCSLCCKTDPSHYFPILLPRRCCFILQFSAQTWPSQEAVHDHHRRDY